MNMMSRRRFAGQLGMASFGLASAGVLSAPLQAASNDSATPFDITPYVHPELRRLVPQLLPMSAAIPTKEVLPRMRKEFGAYSMPALPVPAWNERSIAGPTGAPDVRVVIVNAKTDGSLRPCILHTHGGGFIVGDAKSGLRALQEIAQALDCLIVSVDYRLAPETRFAGALEDNFAALKWLYQHAHEIGGNRDRIALFGESAGGGHAAILALAARDRGEVPVVYQALIYPMLDDRTGSTRRKPPTMGAIIWTEAHNRFGWTSFLGVPAGSRRVPKGAVPARFDNLKGLPPAFIGVGSIDLFVDEDIEYAQRLIDSGVPAELHVVPGAFHGFDVIPGTTIGPKFKELLVSALRVGLA
jgi:acetyl esterase/lipase